MKAISNSSVLIALSSINQLPILSQRFPEGVIVPQAVWHEVVETGGNRQGASEIATGLGSWLSIATVTNTTLVALLEQDLDYGESEAIALFCENPVEALLLDEKKARQISRRMKLPILGTLGLLIWAKQQNIIPNLKDQLDALTVVGKFRLSQAVYDEALKKVGE